MRSTCLQTVDYTTKRVREREIRKREEKEDGRKEERKQQEKFLLNALILSDESLLKEHFIMNKLLV